MAARKKTSRKNPTSRKTPASRTKAAPRAPRRLPDDAAWRELVETAVAKPSPSSQAVSVTPPRKVRKAAKKK